MNFLQLACNSMLRNSRIYFLHIFSSSIAIMIFFIFALLRFHPGLTILQNENGIKDTDLEKLVEMLMDISQYIVLFLATFFIFYSMRSFLRKRRKEFGILMVHGMSPSQLNRIIFIETMLAGSVSILIGISIGLVFAKLALLVFAHITFFEYAMDFYFPQKALQFTIILFLSLFIIISFIAPRTIRKKKLITLLKSSPVIIRASKASFFFSCLSIILLILGYGLIYYFSLKFKIVPVLKGFFLIVMGTYFFFSQFTIFLFNYLKNKKFSNTWLLSLSELVYRVRDHANTFFLSTIMLASALIALSYTFGIIHELSFSKSRPIFSLHYQANKDDRSDTELEAFLQEADIPYQHLILPIKKIESNYILISEGTYHRLTHFLKVEPQMLSEGETFAIGSLNYNKHQHDSVHLEGKEFKIARIINGQSFPHSELHPAWIVSNVDYNKFDHKEKFFHGFLTDKKNQLKLSVVLSTYSNNRYWLDSQETMIIAAKKRMIEGLFIFIGSVLSLFLFTFSSSFIYARVYDDIEEQKKYTQSLFKLGLSERELWKSMTPQLFCIFFLPLLLGVIHSIVAFITLQSILKHSFIVKYFEVLIVFVVLQSIYFLLVRKRFVARLSKWAKMTEGRTS